VHGVSSESCVLLGGTCATGRRLIFSVRRRLRDVEYIVSFWMGKLTLRI